MTENTEDNPVCVDECDHEWIDDSFDHEYGTEVCGHWECINCGHVNSDSEPPVYDDDF